MRVLSIGRPLADPSIDNATIFSAPALFEYAVVVLDPAGISAAIAEAVEGRGGHHTLSGVPVVNGEPAGDALSIAELLRRRRDELVATLERGALVVVFAAPQAALPQVLGFTGADRYWLLPAPAGLTWGPPLLHWAEGHAVAVADHAHPFARWVDAVRDDLQYRALFDQRAPGFDAAARVIARASGGAPAAAEFHVLGGRVVFLPMPAARGGDAALRHGAALASAARELLDAPDPTDAPPYWLAAEALPGLDALAADAVSARDIATRAEERALATEREAAAFAQPRDVLWLPNGRPLLAATLRCAALLGFAARSAGGPPLLTSDEGELLLEVEAADAAVGMAPHYRLRTRLDALLEREGRSARGLIVVNGWRGHPPDRRDTPYIDALRAAAEAHGYALLPAPELYAAARAVLSAAPLDTAALRARLLATSGVVTLNDLLPSTSA
ncbi:MAG: hypothetical protein EXR63_01155 [Dehalococcoidia bacterium]|nr:hypothetical protein [Dehalococcoidia bacterium]